MEIVHEKIQMKLFSNETTETILMKFHIYHLFGGYTKFS